MVMFDDKAQLHTLEGVGAATIMLLVIIYAIDATSMTPQTSSTSSVHIENELQYLGQDILNTLDYAEPGYSSNLKNDVLNWDGDEYIWSGAAYLKKGDNTQSLDNNITRILNSTMVRRGIAHDVEVTYLDTNSTPHTKYMIYNGDPSNNAVIVSRKIVLQRVGSNGDDKEGNNINPTNPIMPIDPSINLYNIVNIRLILWRM
jgi:hypothetical protein